MIDTTMNKIHILTALMCLLIFFRAVSMTQNSTYSVGSTDLSKSQLHLSNLSNEDLNFKYFEVNIPE